MGVLSRPNGNHPHPLRCHKCDTEYWTDETMTNECPDCHSPQWESRMDEVNL